MPAAVYARGFIRTYCQYLGLNPEGMPVIAPWTARNARALDGPALISTNGGSNLLIGATSARRRVHLPRAGRAPALRDRRREVAARPLLAPRRAAAEIRRRRRAGRRARAPCASRAPSPSSADPAAHLAWSRAPAAPPAVRFALGRALHGSRGGRSLAPRGPRGRRRVDRRARRDSSPVVAAALTHLRSSSAPTATTCALVPLLCPLAGEVPAVSAPRARSHRVPSRCASRWASRLRTPPTWDGALYHRAARGPCCAVSGYSCFMFGPLADPTVRDGVLPRGPARVPRGRSTRCWCDGDLARARRGRAGGRGGGGAGGASLARPMLRRAARTSRRGSWRSRPARRSTQRRP